MRRGNDDSSDGAGGTQTTQTTREDSQVPLAAAGGNRNRGGAPPPPSMDKPRAWRIALVDDHPFVREAYEAIIGAEPDLVIVASFGSSRDLTAAFRQTPVDVVLLDYRLADEDIDGVSLIQRLRAHFPATRLLVCSASDNAPTINASMLAGAHGFLSKAASLPALIWFWVTARILAPKFTSPMVSEPPAAMLIVSLPANARLAVSAAAIANPPTTRHTVRATSFAKPCAAKSA